MLELREVTKENLIEITDLEMEDEQKGFVEDNLFSIAECYLYDEFVPKGIYDGDTPVGFVLYYFVEDDPDYVFLHRIMIDKHQQGKGYGLAAMELCFREFKKEFRLQTDRRQRQERARPHPARRHRSELDLRSDAQKIL